MPALTDKIQLHAIPAGLLLASGPLLVPAQFGAVEVAQLELQTLANQMVVVHIDTNWFTTLENLDDLPSPTTTRLHDYINHLGGALVIDPYTGRFPNPPRLDLLNRPPGLSWQGPYVTYQPNRIDDANSLYDEGTPLDPWGRPYLFYSPLGLVVPRSQSIELTGYQDSFDSYTLVSLGPDGVVSGDDLIRTIAGFPIAVPSISSVRIGPPADKSAAWELRVKGYRFGATRGSGVLLRDGLPLEPIATWTDTLVTAPLADVPPPGTVFTLAPETGTPAQFEGFLIESPTAVADWVLY
jgi:hypothetical protein